MKQLRVNLVMLVNNVNTECTPNTGQVGDWVYISVDVEDAANVGDF
jgi:hypothetical protein